jgi:putative ABC transport system substrate-binding protein
MKRREFIAGLGGAVVLPLASHAQQGDRVQRIGVLISGAENTQTSLTIISVLRQGLANFGWAEGRNLITEIRFGTGDPERIRAYASELVNLNPDLIITVAAAATKAVQRQTQIIPSIFIAVGDPVANGIVKNVAHPEGNITGITNLFASFGGKWIELLKEFAPHIKRVGLIYTPPLLTDIGADSLIPSIEEGARTFGINPIRVPFRGALDIVRAIDAFALEPDGGLIALPPSPNPAISETILRIAEEHQLPAIYNQRSYAAEGGLMSYGPNFADLVLQAARWYVGPMLRGAKPGDLPIQFPTKFELVINLKTAKAIGLSVPESLLLRADEVIE